MEKIRLTEKSSYTLITLQSGVPYNVIDDTTLKEIAQTLAERENNPECHAVVLWGGKHFAVGADLGELRAKSKFQLEKDERRKNWQRIAEFSKPIIAGVNGFALGAGNELVLLSDIVIVGGSARLGQPEINLGLIPGAGGSQRLVRAVGKSMAMEMVLTGRTLSATEALSWGLASKICQDELTLETAEKMAQTISQLPPLAIKAAKRSILQSYQLSLSEGLDYEYQAFCELAESQDREEGIRAFLEKRPPKFEGK